MRILLITDDQEGEHLIDLSAISFAWREDVVGTCGWKIRLRMKHLNPSKFYLAYSSRAARDKAWEEIKSHLKPQMVGWKEDRL